MAPSRYMPAVVPLVHELRETCFMYDALAGLLDEVLSKGVGREVLSLGCGTGSLEWRLAERGYAVTGIDVDAAAVAHAKELCALKGVQVQFKVEDMFLVADSPRVDAVLVLYTEAPVARLRNLLEQLAPTVRGGGLFVTNLAASGSESVGSSHSYIDIFPEAAPAVACLSAYLRTPAGLRGNEVYLREEKGGLLSLVADFTDIPVEFPSKSSVPAGASTWVPGGWQFQDCLDLDAACPSAAPPICQQALVVLQRTDTQSPGANA